MLSAPSHHSFKKKTHTHTHTSTQNRGSRTNEQALHPHPKSIMLAIARSINNSSRKVAPFNNVATTMCNYWTSKQHHIIMRTSPLQMFFATSSLPTTEDDASSNTASTKEDAHTDDAIIHKSPKPTSNDESPHPRKFKRKLTPRRSLLDSLPITFADISRAQVAIRDGIKRTTCEKSFFLSELIGANIYLKTDHQQFTGSFKERGARNAILSLITGEGGEEFKNQGGCIAASAGNHALAMAYHGKELGVRVTVVMPTVAPLSKVDKCKVCDIYADDLLPSFFLIHFFMFAINYGHSLFSFQFPFSNQMNQIITSTKTHHTIEIWCTGDHTRSTHW